MIMMNILETATQLFAKIVKNIMELRILIKNSKSKRDFDINLISKRFHSIVILKDYHISIRLRRAFIELPYIIQRLRITGIDLMRFIIILLGLLHCPSYHIRCSTIDIKTGNIGVVLNCLGKVVNCFNVLFGVITSNSLAVICVTKAMAYYWGDLFGFF